MVRRRCCSPRSWSVVVGWRRCCRQITGTACVDHRVDAVRRRGQERDRLATSRLEADRRHATPTPAPSSASSSSLVERRQGPRLVVVLVRAGGRNLAPDVDDRSGHQPPPGIASSSMPASAAHERRRHAPAPPGTYTPDQLRPATAEHAEPGWSSAAAVAARRRGHYELYYLFPMTEEQRHPRPGPARPDRPAGVLLLVLLARHRAGWSTRQVVTPGPAGRAGSPSGSRRAGSRSGCRSRGEDDIARLATSFNQMADNLQRQIRQLEELSRVQRRFVSDVSHELRTPLTTVRMAADVLHDARDDFDPVTARSAELLQSELDRFETLLADLLEISRFDAGAAVLDAEPVDLRDVVHRVVDATEPLRRARASRCGVRCADRPCVAEVDARRIERILRNLVVNAIEHGDGASGRRRRGAPCRGDEHAVAVDGARPRRRPQARARPRWSSTGSGGPTRPAPAPPAAPGWDWRSRSRTPGCTAAGCRRGGEPGDGAQFRLTLPRRVGDPIPHSPLPLVPDDAQAGPR